MKSKLTTKDVIAAVVWGLIAEVILAKGRRKSPNSLLLAKDAFLQTCATYYGEQYAQTIDQLTPSWIILVFIVLALVGGLLGGLFGKKLLKKHFEKAGMV